MKYINYTWLIVPFFLALLAPVVNDCFHIVGFHRVDENRRFNDSLSISIAKLDAFPKGAELFINDNFSFRAPLIAAYKQLKFDVYKVSPDPSRMIIGKNGRYFIAGEEKTIYEGRMNFSPEQLDVFEKEWRKRKRYLDSLGIAMYFVLAPTGLEIYPEDLPFSIRKRNNTNRFEQLEAKFRKHLPGVIVNPTATLKAGKKIDNMYFMLDNHWTKRGGFLATQLLLERMQRERFPQLDLAFLQEYTWAKGYRNWGLFASIAGVTYLHEDTPETFSYAEKAERVPNYETFTFKSAGVSLDDQQKHFLNPKAKNKLKLLVIRDSFGEAMYPFLKEAFAESVFIFDSWSYRLNKSIIEQYRPDVVVFETYDPHLENQLDPANWE